MEGYVVHIEVKIDPNCEETRVVIIAQRMSEEISGLVKKISGSGPADPAVMAGFKDDEVVILDPEHIIRLYAANQKVFATTAQGEYAVRLRLYELEERLDSSRFIRISNSEIINLKMVERFDLSFAGTIHVKLRGGLSSYVSRRYVSKIKKMIGI